MNCVLGRLQLYIHISDVRIQDDFIVLGNLSSWNYFPEAFIFSAIKYPKSKQISLISRQKYVLQAYNHWITDSTRFGLNDVDLRKRTKQYESYKSAGGTLEIGANINIYIYIYISKSISYNVPQKLSITVSFIQKESSGGRPFRNLQVVDSIWMNRIWRSL